MIFRASAPCNDSVDTFHMRKTAKAAQPADFKQDPALECGTGLICTVYLSLTTPGTPPGTAKGFARAGNKALIYNI
jgi:hypothetical protein